MKRASRRRAPRWHHPPPYLLHGVPCVRCGYPGHEWIPQVGVWHAANWVCNLPTARPNIPAVEGAA